MRVRRFVSFARWREKLEMRVESQPPSFPLADHPHPALSRQREGYRDRGVW
jgi:hypothetical protein